MNRVVGLIFLVVLTLCCGISRSQAASATVRVHNYTTTYLTVHDLNTGISPYIAFGGNGTPAVNTTTTLVLDDTHNFNLGQFFYQTVGHEFKFVGGMLTPVDPETEYFEVVGNDIYVSGVEVRWDMVTAGPSKPPNELICKNSGCLNGAGFAFLGGSDFVLWLPPDDGSFNGKYDSIQFFSSGSNLGFLTLANDFGIANFTGTGHSYVQLDHLSILATLNTGNQFIISANVPEPSASCLALLAWASGLWFKRRAK